ncbi:hypothetical protein H310_10084 [Aphanomyces invadans]|uniref:Uncharacterized protein n=1 Tax=Aphanomyces invadans TaxID=157072 RepID=A0A024TRX7_9STRA|nr:hypothetical protein H310_10084 [Aphanomyces invadans]ETV96778.1 hypothetical protein H310_10084 [Aphanomyces invadans]|eukprot:XP_008874555.1 hypothetical protein H310_10084 [Aphanomyces invadans]
MSSSRAFKVAFKCSACGKCCTGKGGKVRVNTREVEAIADHLSIPTKELRRHYLRRHRDDDFDSLKQTPDDRQCIFLDGKQCSIYPVRPTQCQTYPFWPQQLISKYDWTLASKECEGILLDPSSDDDIIPDDRILKETVIHEVHRSGENITYNEINELVAELDPDMLHAFDQEVASKYRRKIVYEDQHVVVLDSFFDKLPPTRSLHFTDRLQLVQSEVFLTHEGAVDHSYLSLDVHRGLSVALGFLDDSRRSSQWRIAMLGAGASVLPTFWHHLITRHRPVHIQVVEPREDMLRAGREYFDAADALQVHQQFGESFVSESLMAGALMDLIVVDVEDGTSHAVSDDRGDGLLRAPPASMTSFSFLQDIRQLLTPRGVFAVNAIDGDKPIGERAPRGSSVHCLSRRMAAVFDQVWMLELAANVIVFGVKGDSTSSAGPSGWSDENDALQEILDEFRPNLRRVQ